MTGIHWRNILTAIRIFCLVLCIAAALWGYALAYAAIANPDRDPSVDNIRVNHNLLVTGDILIYGDYDIPYDTPPDILASNTYLFQLLDGATKLGAANPYVRFNNGYNNGVFSFYFTSANASGITWGDSYTIRIAQNPAQFASPSFGDFALASDSYTTDNTTDGNQAELANYLLAAANRLAQVYTTETITDTSGAGETILYSPTGEEYFQGAIPGILAMAPALFNVQILEYDPTYRTWSTDYADNQTERFDGTWAGDSANATAIQFGVTKQTAMGFIPLGLCLGSVVLSSIKWRRTGPGLIISAVFLIMALLLGWLSPAIFAVVFQILAILIGYLLFLARAS